MLTRDTCLRWRPDTGLPIESRQLQDEGWTLLQSVFTSAEVTALAAEVTRVFEQYPPDARRPERDPLEYEQFRYGMLNRSVGCQDTVGHRLILDVIEPLLGEDCHILLQDCPVSCGPTGVIPFSHLSGTPPPADRRGDPSLTWNDHEPVTLAGHAGDVQMFVSDIWHRRMPTDGDDNGRLFLQVHCGRRDVAQRLRTSEATHQLSDAAVERIGSDREQTLLGLHQPFFYDG